jgi:hypothetical protein
MLEDKKWPGGKDIVIVLHTDSTGEILTLSHLSGMSAKDVKSFRALHKNSFTVVDSDDDVLHVVEQNPGSLGLVEVRSINDQVRVLKVDGKLPMEAGVLATLSRTLLQQMEVMPRFPHVPRNLFPQRLDGGKFNFVANAL